MTQEMDVALYVHVPFCRARCAYCDFNTTAGLDHLMPAYAKAVCREIEDAGGRWPGATGSTLYLGGGTPSLLPLPQLEAILTTAWDAFRLPALAEVTLEANPGTVSRPYLAAARSLGVNRLSLGVQSADDRELALLGRIHTWDDAVEAVFAARAAGFANLSLDLIYGLPGQHLERWGRTLAAAVDLRPDHLSLYALSVEPGTPLARRIERGEVPRPDDDRAAEMAVLAEEALAEAGFFHYEISNWARFPPEAPDLAGTPSRWWPAGTEGGGERGPELLRLPPQPDLLAERALPGLRRRGLVLGWRRAMDERPPPAGVHRARQSGGGE